MLQTVAQPTVGLTEIQGLVQARVKLNQSLNTDQKKVKPVVDAITYCTSTGLVMVPVR